MTNRRPRWWTDKSAPNQSRTLSCRPQAPPSLTAKPNDGYGFLRQRPMVGLVPHFAPSGAPPEGQNTDTRISLASQLTWSVALDGPDDGSSRPRIALCTGRTLRSLRPLRTLLALVPPAAPAAQAHPAGLARPADRRGLGRRFPLSALDLSRSQQASPPCPLRRPSKALSFRFLLLIASRAY